MGRAPCCDKVGLKRGPWTPEEDQILINFIQKHGHSNWRALPKQAGLLRCGKSCRLRWINYLKPDIKRGNFTKEEEDTIIQLHEMLGNRWSAIAAKLPGRTDNEIKNVWHTHLKKRLENYQTTKPSAKRIKGPKRSEANNVTVSNSNSTSSFDETSSGTVDNVPTSPGNSYTSDGFSSVTEVSSTELPNMTASIANDDQMFDIQQSNVDEFPIIDETFWSSEDFTLGDNCLSNVFFEMTNYQLQQSQFSENSMVAEAYSNSFSSPYNGNGSYNYEDNMDFWLDVFVKSGGVPELPEF